VPDILSTGVGDLDDATLVVLAAGMLHDVGNALHRDGQARNGTLMADPLLRRLLPSVYHRLRLGRGMDRSTDLLDVGVE